MSNNITITSSTVGAIAVGDGATASNGGTEEPSESETFDFKFKVECATREQIAVWLRRTADIVADPHHPVTNDARVIGNASRAWTLTSRR